MTSKCRVELRFHKFHAGNQSLEVKDDRRRDFAFNNEKLKAAVEANPCTIVRKLAIELGICLKTVSNQYAILYAIKK